MHTYINRHSALHYIMPQFSYNPQSIMLLDGIWGGAKYLNLKPNMVTTFIIIKIVMKDFKLHLDWAQACAFHPHNAPTLMQSIIVEWKIMCICTIIPKNLVWHILFIIPKKFMGTSSLCNKLKVTHFAAQYIILPKWFWIYSPNQTSTNLKIIVCPKLLTFKMVAFQSHAIPKFDFFWVK